MGQKPNIAYLLHTNNENSTAYDISSNGRYQIMSCGYLHHILFQPKYNQQHWHLINKIVNISLSVSLS